MALTWQYIAGFFDGEGNVSVPLGKTSFHVAMTQAGDEGQILLREIQNYIDAQIHVRCRIYSAKQVEGRKKVYILHLAAKRAEGFLRAIFPFLHIKKTASQDALRFRVLYPGMYTSPLCRAYRSERTRKANTERTHCKRGHLLTPDNLYSYSRGSGRATDKACKTCARQRACDRYRRICRERQK